MTPQIGNSKEISRYVYYKKKILSKRRKQNKTSFVLILIYHFDALKKLV